MGGFLSSNETIISDVGFLQNYQRVNLKDIQDVMQNFKALHGSDESKMALNVVEFEEVVVVSSFIALNSSLNRFFVRCVTTLKNISW